VSPSVAVRLVVGAVTVAAVQAAVIDTADVAAIRHLDLPLAVAICVVLLRPIDGAVVGFVFGLAVDAFSQRLFGLHALAYTTLAPIAAHLPTGVLRNRAEAVTCVATVQSIAATGIVAAGGWVLSGVRPVGLFGLFVQVSTWSVAVTLVAITATGNRFGPPAFDRPVPAMPGDLGPASSKLPRSPVR
jgi:rod shape-determining protein MreD